MTHVVYKSLLWLHPPAFRRQFAPEMLLIFREAAPDEGCGALLFDALVSLVRQWFLRSGLWKAAVGGCGAALQLAPSLWMGRRPRTVPILATAAAPLQLDGFVVITGFLIAFVILMVAASVLWATRVSRSSKPDVKRRLG